MTSCQCLMAGNVFLSCIMHGSHDCFCMQLETAKLSKHITSEHNKLFEQSHKFRHETVSLSARSISKLVGSTHETTVAR